jgi:hypothetical protein
MDFEKALSNAVTSVFGESVGIMRDFFHLKVCDYNTFDLSYSFKQQAIVKKIDSLGLKDFQNEILRDVDVLWYAESALEFETLSTKILLDWRANFRTFADYFQKQWMKNPSEWASFGRPKDAPSGKHTSILICFI